MAELRVKLRSVDSELIGVLARRKRLVGRIGVLKRKLKVGVIDALAEKAAMENFVASAAKAGLEEGYVRRIAELVIEASVDAQMQARRDVPSNDASLKQFSEIIRRAERRGRRLIRFDIGEPRLRTPRAVIREAKRWLSHSPTILYGSSSGLTELTDAIATRLNSQYGTRLRHSNILITPGARFGIFAAMRTNASSLDRVLVCQPAWPAYQAFASLVGARVLSVSTSLEGKWDIDVVDLERALKLRPKIFVLNNPSNPTGKVLSRARFQEVMELARKYHTTVLSDEVYASYCDAPAPSVLEYPDNEAIYISSFSKEFSMTGWRVAYAVADEEKITRMRRIVETTLTNVPELVQRAALAALEDPSREAMAGRRKIRRCLRIACEELQKGKLEFFPPDGGFYIFPRTREGIDSKKFAEHLFAKYAVGVLPGTIFGGYTSFLRLAITEPEEAVRTGVRRIVKAMNEW
ncbi:MAG TPA: aminotransferase class I/II-fold pyridoxal phosphate-dependent enzyme [Candidatus Acidoferrum sp.]|nr:aminotransferase class I/II-fold pyridoxal phosphate-dependent enzyme [Candidatus Acidoferrum sp.]